MRITAAHANCSRALQLTAAHRKLQPGRRPPKGNVLLAGLLGEKSASATAVTPVLSGLSHVSYQVRPALGGANLTRSFAFTKLRTSERKGKSIFLDQALNQFLHFGDKLFHGRHTLLESRLLLGSKR